MATKLTPEEKAEEERKKQESIARYKKEVIGNIEEWLEKVKTGEYVIERVDLQARKKSINMGVSYNNSQCSTYGRRY